jgi:hypothetical protein
MGDSPEPVVTQPVAPRLAGEKESGKRPHVGPDMAACAERRVRDGGYCVVPLGLNEAHNCVDLYAS